MEDAETLEAADQDAVTEELNGIPVEACTKDFERFLQRLGQ